MRFVIPSYNRYRNMKTLATLERHGIPKEMIRIYVVPEEVELYKQTCAGYELVVGKRGLVAQRQFIIDSYPEGTQLVFMDDDIDDISLELTNFTLFGFVNHAFQCCYENNAYLWGVYPVHNPFYRIEREEMSTCLNFIIGCFYGVCVRHSDDLRIKHMIHGSKDDTENTLNHFIKDGVVLRFNKVAVDTKFFAKGGLGLLKDRLDTIRDEVYALQRAFPNYGRIKIRENGVYEYVLKKIYTH
jgi:hypothetical protein